MVAHFGTATATAGKTRKLRKPAISSCGLTYPPTVNQFNTIPKKKVSKIPRKNCGTAMPIWDSTALKTAN